ncbi:hypothetical protein EN962_26165 [Mesorhizobium sp. M7A.F.Ca.CA.001.09.2.1]|uniref:hypothetical protein n=1 Tax=unclassified Mesorhizobium TaxID=325217 RepID=UPI0009DD2592|nr:MULTISPECIES: hypothetical protein [unclassified Mesorhizobium]RUY74603.1 hypothetical protein EN962_26165 [Mesorhizobium sp. M7A.F.Ca.CA.001.09.2.1]RUZ09535.1 hypothetical protein EN955_03960 [Mesorhizobium sp. M7A.F.Ca.CA.001.04.2.1]RUZ28855.1 hypothetical protein EN953_24415 [Mesorhizobium sp. M7A.F.Ca.CA.001.04.1.1]RUZ33228.1 hypothetical protein EN952_29375 [Mesorhizobium sp. M7A.F.Ca.CA.001.15.1.1]RUZ75694.1 hypothetical protein EN942_31940 [Mesorhizobium sp. M7A.F.Ca.CA.001.14.1.1]R
MDPATAAVLLLLSCSPGEPAVCKPIEAAPTTYASLDVCLASLKDRLAGAPNGEIVGRCHPVDETVTGSLPAGYTTVVVTRGVGSKAISNSYIVQHKE